MCSLSGAVKMLESKYTLVYERLEMDASPRKTLLTRVGKSIKVGQSARR